MDERFWVLDAANDDNRLDEIQGAIQGLVPGSPAIVAIVDDNAGGIIAYALRPHAGLMVEALNANYGNRELSGSVARDAQDEWDRGQN